MSLLARITTLPADTSPKAVATARCIEAILDSKVVIPGGIAMLLAELGCDGRVDPEITDANFSGVDPLVSSKGVVPVEINMNVWTDAEATAYLAGLSPPMQPVNPDKGIKWASENKEAQRKSPLLILGQKCRFSDGRVCALVLSGDDDERCASLRDVRPGFVRRYRVLAELKELAPGT